MDVLLSIIVPVYNVDKYLNECIDSILNQTFRDYEIILVDDGSSDRSGKICDDYEKVNSKIKVIHQENMGASLSRLNGIHIAKGRYLGFVDGDDWIDKDMYRELMNKALSADLDMVISGFFIDEKESSKILYPIEKDNLSDLFIFNSSLLSSYCNKIIRKEIINEKYFPKVRRINMYEDNFVTFKLFNMSEKIEFINKAYYHYRSVGNSQTKKYSIEFFNDIAYVLNDLESFAKCINKYDCYEKYFVNEKLNLKLKILESSLKKKYNFARNIFPECSKFDTNNWRGRISRLKLKLLKLHLDFFILILSIFEKYCMKIIRSKN